jgi:hypothetical protein
MVSAFGFRLSAISFQLSAISFQLSAFGFQLAAFGFRLSAFGYQLSAPLISLAQVRQLTASWRSRLSNTFPLAAYRE